MFRISIRLTSNEFPSIPEMLKCLKIKYFLDEKKIVNKCELASECPILLPDRLMPVLTAIQAIIMCHPVTVLRKRK